LVDVGCGYGGTARIAAEEWAANVTGFTISAAQKAYADGIPVMRGSVAIRLQDWGQAALATASVDAVLSLESIEHMPDRGSFLREARRILRPGGRMVVCTWLAAEKMSSWSRRHLMEPIAREGRQAPLVTARELTEVFAAAGFANVQVEELSLQVQRTWSVVIRRLVVRLLTRRRYWRELANASPSDRIFGLTACRIWMAYHTGCMQYALLTGW
jgi:tocopherol O-methyltransferase